MAGAVFSKDDALELSKVIYGSERPTDGEMAGAMAAINTSYQPGGFHLHASNMTIALVASYAATAKCPEGLRKSIITLLIKIKPCKRKSKSIITPTIINAVPSVHTSMPDLSEKRKQGHNGITRISNIPYF